MKYSAILALALLGSTEAMRLHQGPANVTTLAQSTVTVKSRASDIQSIMQQIQKAEEVVDKKEDPNWETLALSLITGLQNPVHEMIHSWHDWYLSNNALGAKENWDPVNNPLHMVKSEVSDVYKAMGKIRALENRVKGLPAGTTNEDLNLLNSLKRELGIPVEFGDANK